MASALSQSTGLVFQLGNVAAPDTLERHYLDDIRPQLVFEMSAEHLRHLDSAVSRFALWRGGCTPIAELSEQLCQDFEAWLCECGLTGKTLANNISNFRRIVRLIDPSICASRAVRVDWEQPAQPGSVRHFFETVYRPLRLRGASSGTVRLYRNSFRNFERMLGREPLLTDLNEDALSSLLGWHLDVRGNDPHTANKDAGQLMALARYAAKKRLLDVEPELKLLTAPVREPLAWMHTDLDKLFGAIDKLPHAINGIRERDWWRAIFLTLYNTAERIAALMGVQWADADLDGGTILVRAELRKGKRSDKLHVLKPVVVEALRKVHRPENDRVFPWPYDTATLYNRLKHINYSAGLPTDRRSMFHRMRRTAASYFKAAGGDPTLLLDHADPKTTRKYLDLRICGTPSAAALLPDPPAEIGGGR